MFFMKSKAAKELDGIIYNIQMNLENNYKDLAISYLKDAVSKFEEVTASGSLKAKEEEHYRKVIAGYQTRMQGYNHTDISKFLHDTL